MVNTKYRIIKDSYKYKNGSLTRDRKNNETIALVDLQNNQTCLSCS